jgi:hypothetical protein
MVRDGAISCAVEHLRTCLGLDESNQDHWDADLTAIAFASPNDPQRLVYFSLSLGEARPFYVCLEAAPAEGDGRPYTNCGELKNVDLETLTEIVSEHLGIHRLRSVDSKSLE